jgi:hypothetical protein
MRYTISAKYTLSFAIFVIKREREREREGKKKEGGEVTIYIQLQTFLLIN